MCNAYNLNRKLFEVAQAAAAQLDLSLIFPPGVTAETSNLPVPSSMFPRNDGLFLRGVDGGLEPVVGRWGMVGYNYKGPLKAIAKVRNNCRSEGMSTTFPFMMALGQRRCVIPMSSFTEWTGPKGSKTKHTITAADGGLLFAAGLWEQSDHTADGPVTSYTMVMTSCADGDDMAPFHDRQPVLLDRERAATWMDAEAEFTPLLCALPAQSLRFDPPEPAGV